MIINLVSRCKLIQLYLLLLHSMYTIAVEFETKVNELTHAKDMLEKQVAKLEDKETQVAI